jgi:hypothetical protein
MTNQASSAARLRPDLERVDRAGEVEPAVASGAGALRLFTGDEGATSPRSAATPRRHSEVRLVLRNVCRFVILAAIVWLVLYGIHSMLPGIRSGGDQVYETKLRYVADQQLFPSDAKQRVVIFGDSRVLSGFIPSTFDRLSSNRVASYNLGLPNATHFVSELEQLVQRGETPTHVLLTVPWDTAPIPSWYDRLRDDDRLMQQLFPFRRLPRDSMLFLTRARSRGGIVVYYEEVLRLLEKMIAERGYHFIESQSHYPNHRLPEGFRLDSDNPSLVDSRRIVLEGANYTKLMELQRRAGFQILFVPPFVREGSRAPTVPDEDRVRFLRSQGIQVAGPDYWVLPDRCFSDPVHLNPEGAQIYTTRLWELLSDRFEDAATSQ